MGQFIFWYFVTALLVAGEGYQQLLNATITLFAFVTIRVGLFVALVLLAFLVAGAYVLLGNRKPAEA